MAAAWKRMGSPTVVTSESENEASDYVYQNEDCTFQDEEEEPTIVQQLTPSISQTRNSDSSSDNSSGNVSQGYSKKKSRNRRTVERLESKVNTMVNTAETVQHDNDSKFETLGENQSEANNHLRILNDNMNNLTVKVLHFKTS